MSEFVKICLVFPESFDLGSWIDAFRSLIAYYSEMSGYSNLTKGVYKTGRAITQNTYNRSVKNVFIALDEVRASRQPCY